jgi:two-component system cell cycle response regulator DivK
MSNTILVIEDNKQNLYLLRFLLESNGYSVAEAQDGREGIQAACLLRPAAILLDIQLPVMNGYAVAEEIRRHEALKTVPIIVVTSYAMAGDREQALAAGATDYIEKPIDPDTFVERIRKHVSP